MDICSDFHDAVGMARLLPLSVVPARAASESHVGDATGAPVAHAPAGCDVPRVFRRKAATAQPGQCRDQNRNHSVRTYNLRGSAMLTARTIMKAREASQSRSTRVTSPSPIDRPDDVHATRTIREAALRVEGEYREMPGLSLTLPQAARLWGLDRSTCELVLANLIERRVLKRAFNGTFVRR
jgi:hypothetical protein